MLPEAQSSPRAVTTSRTFVSVPAHPRVHGSRDSRPFFTSATTRVAQVSPGWDSKLSAERGIPYLVSPQSLNLQAYCFPYIRGEKTIQSTDLPAPRSVGQATCCGASNSGTGGWHSAALSPGDVAARQGGGTARTRAVQPRVGVETAESSRKLTGTASVRPQPGLCGH